MQIPRTFKIAVNPRTATYWCLGAIGVIALVQFVRDHPIPITIVLANTIGLLLWVFGMKLLMGVMCSLLYGRSLDTLPQFARPLISFFMGGEREKLPHFTMTLLGILLFIMGTPFIFTAFFWYIRSGAVPGA
ncbi:hypothetical protein [Denitrobaculum tricleocarpae]|uniref:Uncharacterized protein n=1 Tax=Denitrobaculum tricleocarpae TaxID=2591009 RepID=A0A545U2F0_9PROT|nr:hypothetical protein [Denitrobaculum tricleocarpae]TQV83626.1 hypothetical protein FKG95_03270 [Denitrobaculum tricleocarpae]